MSPTVSMPQKKAGYIRTYSRLGGVDFSSSPEMCEANRSPDALNVYRDYTTAFGSAVETRPGLQKLCALSGRIYGMHTYGNKLLVHHGSSLSLWNNFPDVPQAENLSLCSSSLPEAESVSAAFMGGSYLLTSEKYLVYKSDQLSRVADNAYVPTTRINSDPDGGNAVMYQEVNLLCGARENSFVADGTSTLYRLDADDIDSAAAYSITAVVNGQSLTEGSGFSVNRTEGSVTFSTAPAAAATSGEDNVKIRFSKTITGELEKIEKCTLICVFDNRVFVSGNPLYPGRVFHSELDNGAYFRDNAYYDDGDTTCNVKSLLSAGNALVVIKENKGYGAKVFTHSPALDYEAGKIYPVTETKIMLGSLGGGVNFDSHPVYLSPMGLYGIYGEGGSACCEHESRYVDKKLLGCGDYSSGRLCVWRNYLLVLVGSQIFLADGYQHGSRASGSQYEWYYWNNIGLKENGTLSPAVFLKCIGDKLYFGCANGFVGMLDSTNDCGEAILSYWCTPEDALGESARYKSSIKSGNSMLVKRFANSLIKLDVKTDEKSFTNALCVRTGGFTFDTVNFCMFTFGTGENAAVCFSLNEKKFRTIALRFYSDEADKPFGLYEAAIRFTKKNYIKG